MRYKIGLILILSVGLASYLLYNFVYLSSASGKTIELPIRNESDNQKLDISLGFELKDITNSAVVDEFVARFRGMPVYLKLSNPLPSTINDPNFTKLQDAGVFWQFSSNSYEVLDAAATSYYEKFQGKVLLELTDHNSVDPSKSTVMMAKFPSAKFYADDSFAWSRERVREMVDTKTSSVAIPYPILDGVSFHTSQIKNDVFDDAKSTFDYFYDASSNVQGTSIKIDWGAGNHNLMVSEIKTKTNLDGAEASTQEARKFGILIAAYFNYAQMRGGETNASTKKPIRYVGLGDYSLLSPNSKNLARFFALMTKRRQNISYPNTHRANGNPWDGGFLDPASKPLIGIGTYSSENGYMIVFSNGSNEEITLEISTNINFSGYKTISNFRADGATISPSRQIVFAPYEVIAVYKDSGEDIAPTPTPAPITSSTPTPAPSTTQPSNTPQPTNTIAPSNSPTKTPSLTPTKTKTPTPSSTPTPSQTLTPTKTPTTTLTPTPTPTPILKAFCDTAGCGICGWRGTNGVCQPGGAMPDGNRCCYSTCVNDLCKTVAGFGTDKCSPGQACISPTASYDSRSITTPTPVIKYVVIEPTATIANTTDISTSPKSSMAPVKVTLTSVVTNTISNNAQNNSSPPVSGSDSTIILLLIIPAIILVAGAFIF